MSSRVVVAVGTKKGLFVLEGRPGAKRLDLRGPFFPGQPLNTAFIDRRSKTPKVVAVPSSPWFGTTIQISKDLGKKFKPTKSAPAFAADDGRTLKNVWSLATGGIRPIISAESSRRRSSAARTAGIRGRRSRASPTIR